ncbi:UNVERIFIED_ORG: hypothetical protein J2W85_000140 [Ensifer adhaerens]|nr:hypothetical protein [Ensifer adhaerens]
MTAKLDPLVATAAAMPSWLRLRAGHCLTACTARQWGM